MQPFDYRVSVIDYLQNIPNKSAKLIADIDLLCTDEYLLYASHLLYGKLNPQTRKLVWTAARAEGNLDLTRYLSEAVESGKIEKTLSYLLPTHDEYKSLQNALATYRRLANLGVWKTIAEGNI